MLTCLAMALAGAVALADIPTLAAEVETEARALARQADITPTMLADLVDFSADAMALSESLRNAGVSQDLPCIFRGISEDAAERVQEFRAAGTQAERDTAFAGLRVLLDDAVMLAPMAAGAAADVRADRMAQR